jgi:hypothetical protein
MAALPSGAQEEVVERIRRGSVRRCRSADHPVDGKARHQPAGSGGTDDEEETAASGPFANKRFVFELECRSFGRSEILLAELRGSLHGTNLLNVPLSHIPVRTVNDSLTHRY